MFAGEPVYHFYFTGSTSKESFQRFQNAATSRVGALPWMEQVVKSQSTLKAVVPNVQNEARAGQAGIDNTDIP